MTTVGNALIRCTGPSHVPNRHLSKRVRLLALKAPPSATTIESSRIEHEPLNPTAFRRHRLPAPGGAVLCQVGRGSGAV